MNLVDLLPGLATNSVESDTFYRVLKTYWVSKITPVEDRLEVEGTESSEDFIDRVADVYLGRLAQSHLSHELSIRARFSREEIRASIHRLMDYRVESPVIIPLKITDLFPLSTGEGTFAQCLIDLPIRSWGISTAGPSSRLSLNVFGYPDDFIDRLADVYLGRLALSEEAHDQLVRATYTRDEIRTSLHHLIKWEYNPESDARQSLLLTDQN